MKRLLLTPHTPYDKKNKTPILIPRKGVFEVIFFGSPAIRFRGPMGFASPGYPGFALVGK